jgi:hypothetical protein
VAEPFDLDALAAEADGEPFRFVFGGETYELPAEPDFRVGVALGRGDSVEAMRLMFGEHWDRVLASKTRLTGSMAGKLLKAYMAHTGNNVGESKASSSSSKSTAGRSKRTSRATTKLT